MPPALHVAALPQPCVVFGRHMPVHAPAVQRNGHAMPDCHWPVASQTWGTFPMHCTSFGVQTPVQAPF